MKNNYQIGDWVYDSKRSQYPMQVVAVFGERNGTICDLDLDFEGNEGGVWECKADEVVPIPITAEILEKNGFRFEKYTSKMWTRGHFTEDEIIEIGLWADKGVGIRCHRRNDSDAVRLFNAHYVHQLQQALRLCGIDKEIKL